VRIIQSIFSVLTVLFIYLIGREIKNNKVGLIAAFFFSDLSNICMGIHSYTYRDCIYFYFYGVSVSADYSV